jgi:hypothetical protein
MAFKDVPATVPALVQGKTCVSDFILVLFIFKSGEL